MVYEKLKLTLILLRFRTSPDVKEKPPPKECSALVKFKTAISLPWLLLYIFCRNYTLLHA